MASTWARMQLRSIWLLFLKFLIQNFAFDVLCYQFPILPKRECHALPAALYLSREGGGRRLWRADLTPLFPRHPLKPQALSLDALSLSCVFFLFLVSSTALPNTIPHLCLQLQHAFDAFGNGCGFNCQQRWPERKIKLSVLVSAGYRVYYYHRQIVP